MRTICYLIIILSGFQILSGCQPDETHQEKTVSRFDSPRVKILGESELGLDESHLTYIHTTDEFIFPDVKAVSDFQNATSIEAASLCQNAQGEVVSYRAELDPSSSARVMSLLPLSVLMNVSSTQLGAKTDYECSFNFRARYDSKLSKYLHKTAMLELRRSPWENELVLSDGKEVSWQDFAMEEHLETNEGGLKIFEEIEGAQARLRCRDFETGIGSINMMNLSIRNLAEAELTWVDPKWNGLDPRNQIYTETCRVVLYHNSNWMSLSPYFDLHYRIPEIRVRQGKVLRQYRELADKQWVLAKTKVENVSLTNTIYLRIPAKGNPVFEAQPLLYFKMPEITGFPATNYVFDYVRRPIHFSVEPSNLLAREGDDWIISLEPRTSVELTASVKANIRCKFQNIGLRYQIKENPFFYFDIITAPLERVSKAPSMRHQRWAPFRFSGKEVKVLFPLVASKKGENKKSSGSFEFNSELCEP